MKIADVKLRFAKHYLFVQVYTDAGIVGLGEAGNWGYLQATAAAIEKFADYLIGKDPFRIEDFNQNFLRSVYFRGSVIMSAISAIDIALWDIKGKALGEKRGVRRYASLYLPMDEALILCAVDLSGRGGYYDALDIPAQKIGRFDTELVYEFMNAFAVHAGLTLHLRRVCGRNSHHIVEGAFKALGRALREAAAIDPEGRDEIPSTKGML